MSFRKLTTITACACMMLAVCMMGGCGDDNKSSSASDNKESAAQQEESTDNADDSSSEELTTDSESESTDEEVITCVLAAVSKAINDTDVSQEMGESGYIIFQSVNDIKSIKYEKLSALLEQDMAGLNFSSPKEEGKAAFQIKWGADQEGNSSIQVVTITVDELVAITDQEAQEAQEQDDEFVEELEKKNEATINEYGLEDDEEDDEE